MQTRRASSRLATRLEEKTEPAVQCNPRYPHPAAAASACYSTGRTYASSCKRTRRSLKVTGGTRTLRLARHGRRRAHRHVVGARCTPRTVRAAVMYVYGLIQYYAAVGRPAKPEGPQSPSDDAQKSAHARRQVSSRHRHTDAPDPTPPDYWYAPRLTQATPFSQLPGSRRNQSPRTGGLSGGCHRMQTRRASSRLAARLEEKTEPEVDAVQKRRAEASPTPPRGRAPPKKARTTPNKKGDAAPPEAGPSTPKERVRCLLYTSDAADE